MRKALIVSFTVMLIFLCAGCSATGGIRPAAPITGMREGLQYAQSKVFQVAPDAEFLAVHVDFADQKAIDMGQGVISYQFSSRSAKDQENPFRFWNINVDMQHSAVSLDKNTIRDEDILLGRLPNKDIPEILALYKKSDYYGAMRKYENHHMKMFPENGDNWDMIFYDPSQDPFSPDTFLLRLTYHAKDGVLDGYWGSAAGESTFK